MFKKTNILFAVCCSYLISISAVYSQSPVFFNKDGKKDSIYAYPPINIDEILASDTLINSLPRNKNGTIILNKEIDFLSPSYSFRDTMFYNPAYLPMIFEGKLLPESMDFRKQEASGISYHLISPDSTLRPLITKAQSIQNQRKNYYANPAYRKNIKYSARAFSHLSALPKESEIIKKNILKDLLSAEQPMQIVLPDIEKIEPEPVFWRIKGEHSLQVSQNHISDNWHQGGNSSFMVRNYHKFNFDYKKDKVSFQNTTEWKLGFQNSRGDTLRDITINEDLFRTYSVLGYHAYENWSYSATLELKTPFFNTYPENSNNLKASLLSPFDLNVGIGMSYTLDKKFENKINKHIKFSANISPLSLNFRYIRNDKVDETSFGLKKGRNTETDYGSLINANLDFQFNGFVSWTSRFKYFTDYERAEAEFENKLNMSLNRYFSTTIILYLRFDDNVPKDDKLKYFQFNELLSFGLNYKW